MVFKIGQDGEGAIDITNPEAARAEVKSPALLGGFLKAGGFVELNAIGALKKLAEGMQEGWAKKLVQGGLELAEKAKAAPAPAAPPQA